MRKTSAAKRLANDAATALHAKIKEQLDAVKKSTAELGRLLQMMHADRLYEQINPAYPNFDAYCHDACGFSLSTAYTYIRVWEAFGHETQNLGISKLSLIRALPKEEQATWTEKARAISSTTLRLNTASLREQGRRESERRGGHPVAVEPRCFRAQGALTHGEKVAIDQAIQRAMALRAYSSPGAALADICQSFMESVSDI